MGYTLYTYSYIIKIRIIGLTTLRPNKASNFGRLLAYYWLLGHYTIVKTGLSDAPTSTK